MNADVNPGVIARPELGQHVLLHGDSSVVGFQPPFDLVLTSPPYFHPRQPFNAVPGVIVHANQLSLIRLGTSARESSILERWFLTDPDTRRRALARAPRSGAVIVDVRLLFHVTTL